MAMGTGTLLYPILLIQGFKDAALIDKQSNNTDTNSICCCPLLLGTLDQVREISVWTGGNCLWPPLQIAETVRLHQQGGHCRAHGTASRAQGLETEMLTHTKSQGPIYSTLYESVCTRASLSLRPPDSLSSSMGALYVISETKADGETLTLFDKTL